LDFRSQIQTPEGSLCKPFAYTRTPLFV
jgi:hypothetical protein